MSRLPHVSLWAMEGGTEGCILVLVKVFVPVLDQIRASVEVNVCQIGILGIYLLLFGAATV